MSTITLGKVVGSNATINGQPAVTLKGTNGISVTTSGTEVSIDGAGVKPTEENIVEGLGYNPSEVFSNPNLLVNPDFKINQRGKSEYTNLNHGEYFVDRWCVHYSPNIKIGNDGLEITSNGEQYSGIWQKSSSKYLHAGDKFTISACFPEIPPSGWYFQLQIVKADDNTIAAIISSDKLIAGVNVLPAISAPTDGEYVLYTYICNSGTEINTLKISYAKVEFGNAATMFVPPDPATELLKIQSMNDNGTSKLVSNDTLPALMNSQMVSNPNLLINPDFKINQRGKSEYINGFSIDKWRIGSALKLNILDNGYIQLTKFQSGTHVFAQIIDVSDLRGKSLTYSIYVENHTGTSKISVGYNGSAENIIKTYINNTGMFTGSFVVPEDANVIVFQPAVPNSLETITVLRWAKLEYGTVATPFVAPDPVLELIKCGIPDDTNEYGYRPTGMGSNPNMILNPDFKINTLGKTSYVGNNVPAVDGWAIYNNGYSGIELLENGGIRAKRYKETTSSHVILVQGYTNMPEEELTYTLSAKINGSLVTAGYFAISARFALADGTYVKAIVLQINTSDVSDILTKTITIPAGCPSVRLEIDSYGTAVGDYIDIEWVKLEEGFVYTQFESPKYNEEYDKLQSYYNIGYDPVFGSSYGTSAIMNSSNIANDNILLNSNFLINQRGQTIYKNSDYDSSGAMVTGTNKYSVDMWKMVNGDATQVEQISATTGGIKIGYNADIDVSDITITRPAVLTQYIEYPARYSGKTLTASMFVKECNSNCIILHIAYRVDSTWTYKSVSSSTHMGQTDFVMSVTADIPENVNVIAVQIYGADTRWGDIAENYSTISWVKLEESNVPTAYRIPDHSTELSRCQRFLYMLGYGCWRAQGQASSTTSAVCMINIPTSMRTTPTLTCGGVTPNLKVFCNGTASDGTISKITNVPNAIALTLTGTFESNSAVTAHYTDSTNKYPLLISAEI